MDFREQLKKAHLKATPHRLRLLHTLQAGSPLSASALHQAIGGDLSTTYRTLNALMDHGILRRIEVDGQARFQINTHQHYIVCKQCHRLQPLASCPINQGLSRQLQQSGFTLTEHRLELYGYCQDCRKLGT